MKYQFYQDFKTKISFIVLTFICTLIVYSSFRLLIFLSYQDVFNVLLIKEIIFSFIYGLWFDSSIVSILYMPIFFVLLLPIKSTKWFKISVLLIVIIFGIQFLVLCADFIYFPEAKRHMAEELLTIWSDKLFILKYAFEKFWLCLLLVFLTLAILYTLSIYFINNRYMPVKISLIKNFVVILLIICIFILMFRGRFSGRPLGIVDIYKISNSTAQATLSLNGVFTSFHVLRKKNISLNNNYKINLAFDNVQKILTSDNEFIPNSKYPLMRQIKNVPKNKKYNVIIVLLESWSPRYIDSLSGTNYGVTPNFDDIVSNGIVFTNAYAVGVRSIFGISAVFAGVPLVPGLQQFSYGLELNNIFSIVNIFNTNGYYTAFMQSSNRESYQMCNITKNIFNVKESFGKEDMPNLMNYLESHHFGYDYDLFMFLSDKATKQVKENRPFFIFAFTGTTHTPFNKTINTFEKYQRKNDENKYLNTLYYSDYSIGKLIENSKKDGWFDNTIFIFLSDHALNTVNKSDFIKDKFNIPFIIYAPKILEKRKINYAVSQLDIIPTLCHIFGTKVPFTALGKNALDEKGEHFAFASEGTNLVLFYDSYFMRHSRQEILETNAEKDSKIYRRMEEILLSLDKVVTESFSHNNWYN